MRNKNNSHRYDDMIHLHRPSSPRKKMPISDRAAQFAPFAALTGHKESILETQRYTEEKKLLSKENIDTINHQIQLLKQIPETFIVVTYFQKDIKKKGGHYLKKAGIVKRIDDIQKCIIFTNKEKIQIENILTIESDVFSQW